MNDFYEVVVQLRDEINPRIKTLKDVQLLVNPIIKRPVNYDWPRDVDTDVIKSYIKFISKLTDYKDVVGNFNKRQALKLMRVILTGKQSLLPVKSIIEVMDVEEIKVRIELAEKELQNDN